MTPMFRTGRVAEIAGMISIRSVLQIGLGVVIGYGSDWDAATKIFYPESFENMIGTGVSIDQLLLVAIVLCALLLRAVQPRTRLRGNPVHGAMALLLALFGSSFLRMVIAEGRFRIPYEFITATFYLAYLATILLFDPEETPWLFGIILVCAGAKGMEATAAWILERSADDYWGAMTLWRDGYILSMFIVAWLLVYTFRRQLPRYAFTGLCGLFFFVALGAVVSYRRSYLVAIPIAAIPVYFFLRRAERSQMLKALLVLTVIGTIAVLWSDASRFVDRLSMIGNPLDEHSTAYRLWEFDNVRQTVLESPWVGYPMGVPWKIYSAFAFPVLSPLGSHNTYMNFLLRGGVFGLGLFLWFAFTMFRVVVRSIRRAVSVVDTVTGVSLLAWVTMLFVASNTAPILSEPRGAALVGVVAALVALQYERVVLSPDRNPSA